MGNSTLDSSRTLKFIDTLQDRHFGEIDVFRTEDGRFVMRVKRTHIIGDVRHSFFGKSVEWVRKELCQFVVPIMHIKNQIERGLCIQFEVSEIYSEYYNFTLLDLLRTKKELEQSELWYILETLLILTTTLRKNKLAINLKADNIFITLKGIPCVYLHHFLPLDQSIIFSQFNMAQQISIILMQLSTSEEIDLSEENDNKRLLVTVGKVCARYKLLGKIIKELLNRQKNEQQIMEQVRSIFQSGKANKFSEIKLNKFRYALPEQSNQKPLQRQNTEPKKRLTNNQPISFKPKKPVDDSKQSLFKSQSSILNNEVNASNGQLKLKQQELKKKLNQIMPKKQYTEKLFDELIKRKEECQAKLQRIATKKGALIAEGDKQNKIVKGQNRKNSQPKKGRQRRFTESSKCSNYR